MLYKQGEISIDSIFNFVLINRIVLTGAANNHTKVVIRGIIDNSGRHDILYKSLADEKIYIDFLDGKRIFGGILRDVRITEQAELVTIDLTCVGGSYLMDIAPQKRSYQDVDASYHAVLRSACSSVEDSSVISCKGNDIKTLTPIFQYNETLWGLTCRLAGHLKTVIFPNDLIPFPQVLVGIPERRAIPIPSDAKYTIGRNERGSIYCVYRTSDHLSLGDTVHFLNLELVVMEKLSVYENNAFDNTYILGDELGFSIKRYNLPLSGLALKGTVLDTKGEMLKVHLDIDAEQEVSKACWFHFAPQGGNVMHTMPQHGTKVMLRFNTDSDDSAMATECYRENGSTCKELSDYNYRYYTTEYKKRMAMFPDKVFFAGGSNVAELNDATGIGIKTGRKTHIEAGGPLELHAKRKLTIHTPAHIYMTKPNTDSVIDLAGNEINIDSSNTRVRPTMKGQLRPYPYRSNAKPFKVSKKLAFMALGFVPKR